MVQTRHAAEKLAMLQEQGYRIEIPEIARLLNDAQGVQESFGGRLVAQGPLDERRVLRVIYEETREQIRVVTLYPGRRTRYEGKVQP